MAKYIHKFQTQTEFQTVYNSSAYTEPWLSCVVENAGIRYNKSTYEKMLGTPLTFKIISAGTINWASSYSSITTTIEYKKNDGEWTEITAITGASAPSISVNAGDTVQFRGNNATYGAYSSSAARFNAFSGSTAIFEVEGNIMSLINSSNFSTVTALPSEYTFNYLFFRCTGLTSAENLILPVTTLKDSCYRSMFFSCTSLTAAPELPATTLNNRCYASMFSGCTSLATAPELPATELKEGCYGYMFAGCTSLTTAPELPATTIALYCYQNMFYKCTSLTTAPSILPATALTEYCYTHMFEGCTSLTTAPELPATTLARCCYRCMFTSGTSLTTAPVLPATTLAAEGCYEYMFKYCANLNYIKCLATDLSGSRCVDEWVYGVASSGTFVKNPSMSSWPGGMYGIPNGWTVQDAS